jgi:murein endopeptidase
LTLKLFLFIVIKVALIFLFLMQLLQVYPEAQSASNLPVFPSCDPESEISGSDSPNQPATQFCAQWNPDFLFNGAQCCGAVPVPRRKKKHYFKMCSHTAPNGSYCDEMTAEQKQYFQLVSSGKVDVLTLLAEESKRPAEQAYCTVNNGFLAYGRPVVPTEVNKLVIQRPSRCSGFGTDPMVGMLEWLGREIGKNYTDEKYSKVRLLIGDISAPRGGCLCGALGRKGHASHTSGQDADVGFLSVRAHQESPTLFHSQFDASTNWWFIKKILQNPYACVKVIFLDKKHIRSLARAARKDRDWSIYGRFIRHMPGHRNHMHIRIGKGPGTPGCSVDPKPELESIEEDGDILEAMEPSFFDELKSRQSTNVQK